VRANQGRAAEREIHVRGGQRDDVVRSHDSHRHTGRERSLVVRRPAALRSLAGTRRLGGRGMLGHSPRLAGNFLCSRKTGNKPRPKPLDVVPAGLARRDAGQRNGDAQRERRNNQRTRGPNRVCTWSARMSTGHDSCKISRQTTCVKEISQRAAYRPIFYSHVARRSGKEPPGPLQGR
jgi:hypothetical protein